MQFEANRRGQDRRTIRIGYEASLAHADEKWGQVGLLRSLEWLKPLRMLKARPTKGGFRSLLQIIDSAGSSIVFS